MEESRAEDMKEKQEKLIKTIIVLAAPVILENIFQTLLGTADTYFAGRIHDNAIAAIGVTSLIMNVQIAFYTAVSIGTSSVISRFAGRKAWGSGNEAVRQALLSGIFLGIAAGMVSLLFGRQILSLAGARDEVMEYAVPYYLIVAVPSVFLCLSQILSSCLRAVKDTRTPMIATGISNIINIILNPEFR